MTEILLAMYRCQRCNHKWIPRVLEVKECPKCKNRLWNEKRGDDENEN